MAIMERSLPEKGGVRVSWFRWMSITTPLLILAQATLAGQFLFRPASYSYLRDDHEMLGSLIIVVIVAQLTLALRGRLTRHVGTNIVVINIAIMALAFVQIALGYGSRTSTFAASLHVPNGVLLFGIAVANAILVARPAPDYQNGERTGV